MRLIDADVALLNTYCESLWTESEAAAVRDFLVSQPTVDAVEVVRCHECKYHNDLNCAMNEWNQPDSGYCSYAVRKDEGKEVST